MRGAIIVGITLTSAIGVGSTVDADIVARTKEPATGITVLATEAVIAVGTVSLPRAVALGSAWHTLLAGPDGVVSGGHELTGLELL